MNYHHVVLTFFVLACICTYLFTCIVLIFACLPADTCLLVAELSLYRDACMDVWFNGVKLFVCLTYVLRCVWVGEKMSLLSVITLELVS